MKANIIRLSFLTFGMYLLTSCGISVKGENGKTYDSYQECCAANDYQAAHEYLVKMENGMDDDDDKISDYRQACDYVFQKEALYLMSLDDESAKKRLIFLLKEDKEDYVNKHIDMVIDLAIDNDDEELVKKLIAQYNENSFEKGNPSKAIEYLANKPGDKEYLAQYIDIRNEKILTALASLNSQELSDAIVKAVSKMEIYSTPLSSGLHEYKYVNSSYPKDVKEYNQICDKVLDIAIGSENIYLAQKILLCYKQNVETFKGGTDYHNDYKGLKAPDGSGVRVDGNHSYVWFTNEDKNNAQKKYQDAINKGAFN